MMPTRVLAGFEPKSSPCKSYLASLAWVIHFLQLIRIDDGDDDDDDDDERADVPRKKTKQKTDIPSPGQRFWSERF